MDNTNRGALFIENKQLDKHPDYKGFINIDGKKHNLAVWKQISKAGKEYLSMSVDTYEKKEVTKTNSEVIDEAIDKIPF